MKGPADIHVVLIDNQDSFVYNLVDALAVAGYRYTVYRNTVDIETVLAAQPDLICLSPGPGHSRAAGTMMQLIDKVQGTIPLLGICLGFQAILEHCGGSVGTCGPVHGTTDVMELTEAGLKHPIFHGEDLTIDAGPENNFHGRLVPIARYHSLGCPLNNPPDAVLPLASSASARGEVIMAAEVPGKKMIGLQFHPESILSPQGPVILDRCISYLLSTNTKTNNHD